MDDVSAQAAETAASSVAAIGVSVNPGEAIGESALEGLGSSTAPVRMQQEQEPPSRTGKEGSVVASLSSGNSSTPSSPPVAVLPMHPSSPFPSSSPMNVGPPGAPSRSAPIVKAPDAVKLFVGQLPKMSSETELLHLFEAFGTIYEFSIIRDRATGVSRGCAFLTFTTKAEADNCLKTLHSQVTVPGMTNPLQVKYADGEQERLEAKVFVGMMPKSVDEPELRAAFAPFGNIVDLTILRTHGNQSKGCGFVKFSDRKMAMEAINQLHGSHPFEASTTPLVVKFADTPKQKQARQVSQAKLVSQIQQLHTHGWNAFPGINSGLFPPSLGSLSQQAVLAQAHYNNLAQVASNAHQPPPPPVFPHALQPTASHVGVPSSAGQPPAPPHALQPPPPQGLPPQFSNNPAAAAAFAAFAAPHHHQASLLMQQASAAAAVVHPPPQPPPHRQMGAGGRDTQSEGPPGANLFIYHLPPEFRDSDLGELFVRFGYVLSAKVFIDKETGQSKCFGFVSFDNPSSAHTAILTMNGFQIGSKRLKVQLKRDRSSGSTVSG